MADDSMSRIGSASSRNRTKPTTQRSASLTAARPKSSSGARASVSGRGARAPSTQRSQERDEDEDEAERPEEKEQKCSRAELEVKLETMTSCYEHANRRVQELESRTSDLSRKCRGVTKELDDHLDRFQDVERENARLHRKLTSISSNLDTTKTKLSSMEWKAMEYEKMSILNDNLKTKNETLRQDNRDLERRLREAEKALDETHKELEIKEKEVEKVNERMQDLRLQVKEEAIKNAYLDKEVEDLQHIRSLSTEKDDELLEVKKKLHETELLLEHARKSWKEEREKVTCYENEDKANEALLEEVEIMKAENMTLKKLLIAKDTILIQKTRTVDNIKNRLSKSTSQLIDVEVLYHILDSKPAIKPSFPVGHKLKQDQYEEGSEVHVNGWIEDPPRPSSSLSPRRAFFDSILQQDDSRNNNVRFGSPQHKRPKTAIVKPNNYKVQSFVDFRSSSEVFQDSTNKDSTKENDKPAKSPTLTPNRGHYAGQKLKSAKKSRSPDRDHSRIRRTKSVENKIYHDPPEGSCYRPPSPGAWSSTRTSTASMSTVGSSGCHSIPAIMLKAAPERDREVSRAVHVGDRVYVDMSRSKEKRKHSFQQAVVKFIGNLDKECDCYRIYMGIKLDEPVGDTDGIYKGKRYFKVTEKHGKFVRITRITSIFNRQTNRFQDLEDILTKQRDIEPDKTTAESQESFELKL